MLSCFSVAELVDLAVVRLPLVGLLSRESMAIFNAFKGVFVPKKAD